MRRRLLRPVVLIPALVLASLGAGIGYAAWTQLDAGRERANEALLESLPELPGAIEADRLTQTSADGGLPVPDEVTTSVLYRPPPGATQADVVAFYVARLTPEWQATTESVALGADGAGASAFRVGFSRGDDCVELLTYGMVEGAIGGRTFALSARSGEGPCEPE